MGDRRYYNDDDGDDYGRRQKKAAPRAPPTRARAFYSDSESDQEPEADIVTRQVKKQDSYRGPDPRDDRRDGERRGFVPRSNAPAYGNSKGPRYDYDQYSDEEQYGRRRESAGPSSGRGSTGWKPAGNKQDLEAYETVARQERSARGDYRRRPQYEDEDEEYSGRKKGWQSAAAKRSDPEESRGYRDDSYRDERDRRERRSTGDESYRAAEQRPPYDRRPDRPEGSGAVLPRRTGRYDEADEEVERAQSQENGRRQQRQREEPVENFDDDEVVVPRRGAGGVPPPVAMKVELDSAEEDEFERRYGKDPDRKPKSKGKNVFEEGGLSEKRGTRMYGQTKKNHDDDAFANKYEGELSTSFNAFTASPLSLVTVAPNTPHLVKCTIIREKESYNPLNMTKFYPQYQLILEETNKVILLAKKMNMNKTSNYHMFDMTRGQVSSNLTKKSGNYIGKLRATNYQRSEYLLITQNAETREEIGGIVFDRYGLYDQITEGTQPRKISVIIPPLDSNSCPVPHLPVGAQESNAKMSSSAGKRADSGDGYTLIDKLRSSNYGNMHVFESKDPMYEKGNYRLNFNGRVTIPSVKNFQLVPPTNNNNVVCQFGKVGADHFHLDYKAPLNAIQAFALALCQFNI